MFVIWIAGLAGAGKTTLANALKAKLLKERKFVIHLDGDEVRAGISSDLGYSTEDRKKHINRIQKIAKIIVEQKAIVIVSALYFDREIEQWSKKNYQNYFDVYIEASLDFLKVRDQKKLYSRFEAQEITNVVGLDSEYVPPTSPHLIFKADNLITPEIMADEILKSIREKVNDAN